MLRILLSSVWMYIIVSFVYGLIVKRAKIELTSIITRVWTIYVGWTLSFRIFYFFTSFVFGHHIEKKHM